MFTLFTARHHLPWRSNTAGAQASSRRAWCVTSVMLGLLLIAACEAVPPASTDRGAATPAAATVKPQGARAWMTVNERRFAITLVDTEAARTFITLLPLTIDMPDLNANEKHAKLPRALPTHERRPGTIRNGDLMLYGSNTLVLFYLTFDSPYSYTRLGQVDDPASLAQTLGSGDSKILFSREK